MKVAAIAAAATLAACAAAPPETLRNPKQKKRPADVEDVRPLPLSLADRPAITLPPLPPPKVHDDPSELVRWPLSQATHPALDPAFAIEKVFAQPGVSWIDLCARGVQNRRGGGIAEEHRTYLTAWCEVLKHDAQSALTRLAPLMSTTQRGLPDAVRHDVANIVVDAGPADIAEDLLNRARIDDVAVYDLVAATYAEVGRSSAASYFNDRALAATTRTSPGRCERGARAILLAHESMRAKLIEDFRRGGGCNDLAEDLACWSDPKSCDVARSPARMVHDVYDNWPTAPADARTWYHLGRRANAAFPASGAAELATAALGASLRSTRCEDTRDIRSIVRLARDVRAATWHDPRLDPELDRITVTPLTLCVP